MTKISDIYAERRTNKEGAEYWEVSVYFETGVEKYFTGQTRDQAIAAASISYPQIVDDDIEIEEI